MEDCIENLSALLEGTFTFLVLLFNQFWNFILGGKINNDGSGSGSEIVNNINSNSEASSSQSTSANQNHGSQSGLGNATYGNPSNSGPSTNNTVPDKITTSRGLELTRDYDAYIILVILIYIYIKVKISWYMLDLNDDVVDGYCLIFNLSNMIRVILDKIFSFLNS